LYFHVSDISFCAGNIITKGHYGKQLVQEGLSDNNDINGEWLREQKRRLNYPSKPSRLLSSFVWECLDDAIRFRDSFRQGHTIYEVDFTEQNPLTHSVCYTAWSQSHPNLDLQAQEFWEGRLTYESSNEVFAESDLKVHSVTAY
jgi:hypothetical protein